MKTQSIHLFFKFSLLIMLHLRPLKKHYQHSNVMHVSKLTTSLFHRLYDLKNVNEMNEESHKDQ